MKSPALRRAIKKYLASEKGKIRKAHWNRKYRKWLKLAVLAKCGKGGKVKCCWRNCCVIDPDMLSIDHVFNDPKEDKNGKRVSGFTLYSRILLNGNSEGRYQTLCHNHQWKKEIARRRKASRKRKQ